MRNLFFFIIIFITVSLWSNGYLDAKPCAETIEYYVGTFDNRFKISEADFVSALKQAEAIWEKPFEKEGKQLFAYSTDGGDLPINLVYDYRQETTSALEDLGAGLTHDEMSYKIMEERYRKMKGDYDAAKQNYEQRQKAFESLNDAYQEKVEVWNAGPRTSKEEYKQLEAARVALEKELAQVRAIETQLNTRVREINSMVNALNSIASQLNLKVETYNTIGALRGESFTGGVYFENGLDKGIDVYEFSSRDKLVRILAHEFGHALGLDHVAEKGALMYHINSSKSEVLTAADLTSLQQLCGVE